MKEFTPSWSLPKRLIVAAEKVKQDFKPKYHIPRSKLPDSLIDPDSFPQTNYDTEYIFVNDMTYVFPSMDEVRHNLEDKND